MKFGVREICDVVLKAKANQKVGNKIFYKNEPVIYFDTLKTSSMEGAATTVYAQGGRGNSRLMAWEGERTVTFTMEDALISPAGFMILSGAGLIEGSDEEMLPVHVAEQTDDVKKDGDKVYVVVDQKLSTHADASIYVMIMHNGEIESEPYIGKPAQEGVVENAKEGHVIEISAREGYAPDLAKFADNGNVVLVDYYTDKGTGAQQIESTPDKFGGNYYLEASTLFRTTDGVDMPAEFIIPNCKIQSNFTFTMASSGDPSTFTFTMDAFPDYTRFNKTKKVLAAIQIINEAQAEDVVRTKTVHDSAHDDLIG